MVRNKQLVCQVVLVDPDVVGADIEWHECLAWREALQIWHQDLFAALVHLDFANAQAILQVVPFAVMLAAAVVLKERVRTRQYVAILLGFVGRFTVCGSPTIAATGV